MVMTSAPHMEDAARDIAERCGWPHKMGPGCRLVHVDDLVRAFAPVMAKVEDEGYRRGVEAAAELLDYGASAIDYAEPGSNGRKLKDFIEQLAAVVRGMPNDEKTG